MKLFLYFMVMVAGFATHAQLNQGTNSACNQQAKIRLVENSVPQTKSVVTETQIKSGSGIHETTRR